VIDNPEDSIRKTTNRAEANKLLEELDAISPDTPAEVIDDILIRTWGFSPLKTETIIALMTMRIGSPRSDLYARRRKLLHSTSSTDPVDTIRGNPIDMILLDEAQNWPTQLPGDTITHGSVTGRADRAAVVSSHLDSIDLCFQSWWTEYLREFDYVTQGSSLNKIKAAFRAGYVRGVKDAKKDGA